jgi:hypothetical protein
MSVQQRNSAWQPARTPGAQWVADPERASVKLALRRHAPKKEVAEGARSPVVVKRAG